MRNKISVELRSADDRVEIILFTGMSMLYFVIAVGEVFAHSLFWATVFGALMAYLFAGAFGARVVPTVRVRRQGTGI